MGRGGKRTTSDVLAGEWLNGEARFARVPVHTDTDSVALVLSIDVESGEGSMSMSRSSKQCQHCKEQISIHFESKE
jgi:hypothetical protein